MKRKTNGAIPTASREAQQDGEVLLSTGVRLRAKAVQDEIMMRMRDAVKPPPVPIWHNPDKDRDEENPNDPEYIEATKRYNIELAKAGTNALLMYGVDQERMCIPDGFPGPDDPEWLEERALAKMVSGDGRMARFYDWLTLKAAPTRDDRAALMFAIGRATGVTEADVESESKSAGGGA